MQVLPVVLALLVLPRLAQLVLWQKPVHRNLNKKVKTTMPITQQAQAQQQTM